MRSVVPRRSMIAGMPAIPIATSVVPWRNGRPNESVITTPTVRPVNSSTRSRIRRALATDALGLAEDHLDLARVALSGCDAHGRLGGFDPVEGDDAPLRLRDALL